MRHRLRPTSAAWRPWRAATLTRVSIRAALEAKVATATRPVFSPTSSSRLRRSAPSEPEVPLRVALVESQTSAATPSRPSASRVSEWVASPISGSGSILKSPLWTTAPRRVRRTTEFGSRMECVTVTNSTSNGPRSKRAPRGISRNGAFSASPASASLRRISAAVNGVA